MFRRIKKAVKNKGGGSKKDTVSVGTPSDNTKSSKSAVVIKNKTAPYDSPPRKPLQAPPDSSPSGDSSATQGISYYDESTESEKSHEKRESSSSHHHRHSSHHEMRGYSSGASSIADSDEEPDDDDDEAFVTQSGHVRGESVVGLEDIRSSLLAGGECNVRLETLFGKPIEELYEGVHDGPVLGSGVSGIVRQVTHKITGVHYAVKCLDLGLVKSDEGLEQLRSEIITMCTLDYPNIVQLVEAFEGYESMFLVQELCRGGDLYDRLDEQPDFHYTEAQCCRLVKQMLSAVRYLHKKGIIHRDLKLENFLFSTPDEDAELKMIDFGLAKHFQYVGEQHHEAVGTPYTVAPEVIRGSYNEKADIWSIGVLTYLLLCGDTPFGGSSGEDLYDVRRRILSGKFAFEPKEAWEHVSDAGKDFVKKLLVVDPNLRPNAKGAQRHEWIQTWSKKKEEDTTLNPNVVNALVQFKELSDMQKLLSEVLSFSLLPEQIKDLREEFEKLDNGDGEITLNDLKAVLVDSAEAGSLGALTEEEVEDIFQALRIRKTTQTIRWHDFIAAGLSQCEVDDRNLRLAFDRLDTDGKGYITLDDFMELMGSSNGGEHAELIQAIWTETVSLSDSRGGDKLTYDDFLLLMKGQPMDSSGSFGSLGMGCSSSQRSSTPFDAIPEDEEADTGSLEKEMSLRRQFRAMRSRSMDETKSPKRVTLLSHRSIENVIADESKTPLVVHRSIYRAHREMRLAVLEASKRFEENRAKRQQKAELGVALPMRRLSGNPAVASVEKKSNKAVVTLSDQQIAKACHRGGRTRTKRVKTVSDVSGFF